MILTRSFILNESLFTVPVDSGIDARKEDTTENSACEGVEEREAGQDGNDGVRFRFQGKQACFPAGRKKSPELSRRVAGGKASREKARHFVFQTASARLKQHRIGVLEGAQGFGYPSHVAQKVPDPTARVFRRTGRGDAVRGDDVLIDSPLDGNDVRVGAHHIEHVREILPDDPRGERQVVLKEKLSFVQIVPTKRLQPEPTEMVKAGPGQRHPAVPFVNAVLGSGIDQFAPVSDQVVISITIGEQGGDSG